MVQCRGDLDDRCGGAALNGCGFYDNAVGRASAAISRGSLPASKRSTNTLIDPALPGAKVSFAKTELSQS